MEKIRKADRARQFLPFNSLKGYYDLVKKAEIVKAKRKILAEEELAVLSEKFNLVKPGMLVTLTYYLDYGYIKLEGMVAKIDIIYRTITIVSKTISFNDIIDIESKELDKYYLDKDF